MTLEKAKQLAAKMLSQKRFQHSINVAAKAKQLALLHGAKHLRDQLANQAELAGVLHDIMKEQSKEQMLRVLCHDGIIKAGLASFPAKVWHGPVAAVYLRSECVVEDKDVLSAVFYHTFGKKDMILLEKIIYVADLVSAERNYPNVEKFRKVAAQNIDTAVLDIMREQVAVLRQKGKEPLYLTLDAIAFMERQEAGLE